MHVAILSDTKGVVNYKRMTSGKTLKLVVLGGGTGSSIVLSGLKNKNVSLSAVISVADSGGSTGRLRDEFGFQPVGDLRQSLASLAKDKSQVWIRKLLLYRFSKGNGLQGHNLGNLILTALQDMAGSTPEALEIAEKIFRLNGKIYPVTAENVQLVVEYESGRKIIGEHLLDDDSTGNERVKRVCLTPSAKIYEKAERAIIDSDVIIIGPGDYYSSIMPVLCVDGMKEAFAKSKAKVVYVVNLMTRYTQTHNMSAYEHLLGIEQTIGKQCDYVLINTGKISEECLENYKKYQEFPVRNDLKENIKSERLIESDIVSEILVEKSKYDTTHRSILRHDEEKLSNLLMNTLSGILR